ncbi:hypothetical protein BC833DRAFT_588037 [Globomyces pollinis-pini]|nr:hypothetical protein BC833DRAFT_588037 [Globomyces pollinis-pini]
MQEETKRTTGFGVNGLTSPSQLRKEFRDIPKRSQSFRTDDKNNDLGVLSSSENAQRTYDSDVVVETTPSGIVESRRVNLGNKSDISATTDDSKPKSKRTGKKALLEKLIMGGSNNNSAKSEKTNSPLMAVARFFDFKNIHNKVALHQDSDEDCTTSSFALASINHEVAHHHADLLPMSPGPASPFVNRSNEKLKEDKDSKPPDMSPKKQKKTMHIGQKLTLEVKSKVPDDKRRTSNSLVSPAMINDTKNRQSILSPGISPIADRRQSFKKRNSTDVTIPTIPSRMALSTLTIDLESNDDELSPVNEAVQGKERPAEVAPYSNTISRSDTVTNIRSTLILPRHDFSNMGMVKVNSHESSLIDSQYSIRNSQTHSSIPEASDSSNSLQSSYNNNVKDSGSSSETRFRSVGDVTNKHDTQETHPIVFFDSSGIGSKTSTKTKTFQIQIDKRKGPLIPPPLGEDEFVIEKVTSRPQTPELKCTNVKVQGLELSQFDITSSKPNITSPVTHSYAGHPEMNTLENPNQLLPLTYSAEPSPLFGDRDLLNNLNRSHTSDTFSICTKDTILENRSAHTSTTVSIRGQPTTVDARLSYPNQPLSRIEGGGIRQEVINEETSTVNPNRAGKLIESDTVACLETKVGEGGNLKNNETTETKPSNNSVKPVVVKFDSFVFKTANFEVPNSPMSKTEKKNSPWLDFEDSTSVPKITEPQASKNKPGIEFSINNDKKESAFLVLKPSSSFSTPKVNTNVVVMNDSIAKTVLLAEPPITNDNIPSQDTQADSNEMPTGVNFLQIPKRLSVKPKNLDIMPNQMYTVQEDSQILTAKIYNSDADQFLDAKIHDFIQGLNYG